MKKTLALVLATIIALFAMSVVCFGLDIPEPVDNKPTTAAPTTAAPATAAPATAASTQAPATNPPETAAPTTAAPTEEATVDPNEESQTYFVDPTKRSNSGNSTVAAGGNLSTSSRIPQTGSGAAVAAFAVLAVAASTCAIVKTGKKED